MWMLSIPTYLWGGTRPDRYQIDVLGLHASYPWPGIFAVIAVTTIESAVLYGIIRPRTYRRSWTRALVGLTLFVPWLLASGVLLMHAPLYLFLHFLWVLCVNLILLGLCGVAVVQTLLWKTHPPPP
jgi:hypothetical protein